MLAKSAIARGQGTHARRPPLRASRGCRAKAVVTWLAFAQIQRFSARQRFAPRGMPGDVVDEDAQMQER